MLDQKNKRPPFDHTAYRDFLDDGVIGAAAIDDKGIIVYANQAELQLTGYSSEEYIGKPLSAFYSSEKGNIIKLLQEQQETNNLEVCVICKNNIDRWAILTTRHFTDADNLTCTYIFNRDVTQYKKNEDLLWYLNTAVEELAQARDTHTALQKISKLIVPKFANWFTIDVLNNNGTDLLILAHEDPEAVNWAHSYRKNNPIDLNSDRGAGGVIKTGKPSFVPVITDEMIKSAISDPEKLKEIEKIGLQSVITVPMFSKNVIKGVITFISSIPGKYYDETDLRFAQNLANHIALALDNARLNEAAIAEIQNRRQIEETLKLTQAQLRSALSSGLVGTWTLDTQKNTLYFDESISKMFGVPYSPEGCDPVLLRQLVNVDDMNVADRLRNKAIAEQGVYETEYRITVNGINKWFFVRGKTELSNQNNEKLLTGVVVDITDRKRAEEALKQSEDVFKLIAETIPQKLFVTDKTGQINYYNPQWEEFTGYSIDKIKELTLTHFIHPDDLQNNLEAWFAVVENGDDFQYEHRLRQKDGEYRWHLTRALSLKDDQGRVVKWIGSITDIHDQKLKEQKKDEFISIASHELRTPLTTVKAFFQLAKKLIDTTDRSFIFIDKAGKQLDRLEKLIADLLDVSKINAGKMVYNTEAFNFDEALAEAVESVQHITDDHRIIVHANANVSFKGDKLRVEQVINNFLTNAIKYSPDADQIIIRSFVQENNIIVSVQDFGIGIAGENLNDLFERFYRVDNTAMRFQGLGLGLFIAAEIIKRHNGSFWIESKPGEGSTFYFLLPINGKQDFLDIDTDNKTYYKGNFVSISYNKHTKWLDVDWKGYQNLESVKKGCLIMLDLLRKNQCKKVLNDNTHVLGNWSEAVDWGSSVWFPEMEKAGLEYFAWVYSPSTFSRMAAEKSVDINMGKITAQFFVDTKEAAVWLKNK
ncbi:PAS domain S-box protein [Mucilaginibacter segetis]|uniref:histidine kinase n=1 Tax=Mucilaginibacter segetis TaxID=2793071 RepID=A0A934PTN3_9SPHI|nr:PAS domain S-box protein [Mucilaginibacter segetis]MBK0380629.1 PAS domain S-box protein [Mucilaginibacter segetis]